MFSITAYNFLTTFSKLHCVPSIFACIYLTLVPSLSHAGLTETMSRKLQWSSQSRFGGSEKDCYFLKIPKWQHKLVRDYKRRKLVSYFLNNAAKTLLYGLTNSENTDIEHVFQSRGFFFFFVSIAISTQVASAPLILKSLIWDYSSAK